MRPNTDPVPRGDWRPWVAPAVTLLVPLALFVTLVFLRPDLQLSLLRRPFGLLLLVGEFTLSLGGAAGVAVWSHRGLESPGLRVVLGLAGLFVCTFPAVVLMLLAPIVYAFMFGEVAT